MNFHRYMKRKLHRTMKYFHSKFHSLCRFHGVFIVFSYGIEVTVLGIVVEDCLRLMVNLLRNNVSNQNFFREGSFIQRFTPFFEMSALAMQASENETDSWSEQKVSNVQLMLKVVRILVSPENPQQASTGAQKMMNQSGLLKLLCDILMASGIPADILTEAINTVSEVIRGFPANQEYFSQVNAPSEPPRPAIVVLLMSMINDKQPFSLRCAVLYCFQCYLYKNEQGQSQIVSTLLPSSADVAASVSAGQLLCAGLFSTDPLSNWCAAVALSHCLKGNPTQKEQLLRVQLATSLGNPPVSLLQQCTNIMAQGGDIQTRVGLLMLLCSWLSNCPIAVAHFLHNAANVPYLMAQVAAHGEEEDRLVGYLCALLLGLCLAYNDDSVEKFKKDDLRILMNKRIGLDNLLEKIGYISKSEFFTSAVKSPEIKDDGRQQVLIDHEFTKLFKKLDAAVTKAVEETTEAAPTSNHQNDSIVNHDSIVGSYKELIREQDEELCRLKSRFGGMESSYNQANAQLQLQAQEILQLRNQLSFAQSYQSSQQSDLNGSYVPEDSSELLSLRNHMNNLQINQQDLEKRLQEKENKVQKLEKDLEVAHAQYAVAAAAAELADCDTNDPLSSSLNRNQLEDLLGLRRTVSSLEHEVSTLRGQNTSLQEELDRLKRYGQAPSQANERIQELETQLAEVTEERDSQLKEHEDLLVMLADQEEKLAKYKKSLKEAGQEVSADEEEEDDDGEEEEDEDDDDEEEDNEEDENVDNVVNSVVKSVEESGMKEDPLEDDTEVQNSGFHHGQVQPTDEDTKAILHEACQEESQPPEESGLNVEDIEHSLEEEQPCEHAESPHEHQPFEVIEAPNEEKQPSQALYPRTDEQAQFAQRAVQEQNLNLQGQYSSESQGNVDFYPQEEQRQVDLYSNQDQGQASQFISNQNQDSTNFYSGSTQANFNSNGTQQGYNYYSMPSTGGQMNYFSAQGQDNYDNSFNTMQQQQQGDMNTYGNQQQGYYKTDGGSYMPYPNQMNQYQDNNTETDIKQDAGLLFDIGDNSNDFLS